MSLRRIDVRFALPRLPRRAVVLGLDEWQEALSNAGVEVLPRTGGAGEPDLAVAAANRADEAVLSGAGTVILEGRGGMRRLTRAGFASRAYLPLPGLDEPDLLLPLGAGSPARYALERWRPAATPLKHARNVLAARLAERGAVPRRPLQVVAAREPGPPFLIAAAADFGIPGNAAWFLTPGQGDELTRGVFHLFSPGRAQPTWVLKFARVPDYADPFDRDEAGLALAAAKGEAVSAHAPRLLGRLAVASHHASIETAAVGERLSTMLARRGSQANAREAIGDIAAWIIRVARQTAAPADALTYERRRLEEEVVRAWNADPRLVADLPELEAVLQHNDLGSWNIVWESPGSFTAVDWESARRHGFPLWDLLYFLVDVLPLLDGARTSDERAERAVRILRGEAPSSETLFSWIRKAVAETSLPHQAVGSLATLCWLHHGLSHGRRGETSARVGVGRPEAVPPVERIARIWLSDPALGPAWSRWRA